MTLADLHWFVAQDGSLTVSWQSLAAMVSISSTLVAAAIVYLRLFVDGRLSQVKVELTAEIHKSANDAYLSKHVGEIVDLKLHDLERRVAKVENGG